MFLTPFWYLGKWNFWTSWWVCRFSSKKYQFILKFSFFSNGIKSGRPWIFRNRPEVQKLLIILVWIMLYTAYDLLLLKTENQNIFSNLYYDLILLFIFFLRIDLNISCRIQYEISSILYIRSLWTRFSRTKRLILTANEINGAFLFILPQHPHLTSNNFYEQTLRIKWGLWGGLTLQGINLQLTFLAFLTELQTKFKEIRSL